MAFCKIIVGLENGNNIKHLECDRKHVIFIVIYMFSLFRFSSSRSVYIRVSHWLRRSGVCYFRHKVGQGHIFYAYVYKR